MILFGPGWGKGYGHTVSWKTRLFYKKILSPNHIHAVRDEYSKGKLRTEIDYTITNTNTKQQHQHISLSTLLRRDYHYRHLFRKNYLNNNRNHHHLMFVFRIFQNHFVFLF